MASNIQRFNKPVAGIKAVGLRWKYTIGAAGSPIASVTVTPTDETDPAGSVDVLGAITFDADRSLTQFIAKNGIAGHRYKFRTEITLVNGQVYAQDQYMDVI